MRKLSIILCIALMLSCSACGTRDLITYHYNEDQKPRQYAFDAFDTQCSISFWGVDVDDKAEDYYYSMKTLIENYDKAFSKTNEESEIYAVNHRTTDTVVVSVEVAELFRLAKDFYEWSNKKFDVSAGTLINLWDVKNRTTLPNESEIEEAKKHVANFDYEILPSDDGNEEKVKLVFHGDRQTQYDFGALVKGYCSDVLREMLSNNEDIDAAIVNLGGNVMVKGIVAGRKDGAFRVGIYKPFSDNLATFSEVIDVKNRCVITSGNYQRYFKVAGDDRVYHHIIDPITGYPTNNGLDSVTIVSENGLLGDYLSTTCMLLGEDASKELIDFASKSFGDKNIQAIYIRSDGTVVKYPKNVVIS